MAKAVKANRQIGKLLMEIVEKLKPDISRRRLSCTAPMPTAIRMTEATPIY